MEHELVLPLPATIVGPALRDPALLTRCVPGLSLDAAGEGIELGGRLRLRIGNSTITYRGAFALVEDGTDGELTVLAEGTEVRGDGTATATVCLSVQADGEASTVLRCTGDLTATGRLAEFDTTALDTAGRRLLDHFSTALAAELATNGAESDEADEPDRDDDTRTATVVYLDGRTPGQGEAEQPNDAAGELGDPEGLDDDLEDLENDLDDLIAFADLPDEEPFGLPAADDLAGAAELSYTYQPDLQLTGPVRRSIVGRSAEEVDHTPPRGRYAPTPPAHSARARAATRWGVGAAAHRPSPARSALPWMIGGGAVLLGGAVVVARALRRR